MRTHQQHSAATLAGNILINARVHMYTELCLFSGARQDVHDRPGPHVNGATAADNESEITTIHTVGHQHWSACG